MNNPGRYLALLPPINGADAISGTPYFTANPGDPFKAWDTSITFDWMPKQYITFRWEYGYRHANVRYFSGRGGITPGVNGAPSTVPNPAAGSLVGGTTFVPGPFLSADAGSHLCCRKHRFLPRPAEGRRHPQTGHHGEVLDFVRRDWQLQATARSRDAITGVSCSTVTNPTCQALQGPHFFLASVLRLALLALAGCSARTEIRRRRRRLPPPSSADTRRQSLRG